MSDINVLELYEKLVQNDIVQQTKSEENKISTSPDFTRPDTLKGRNINFVYELYEGAQCDMCTLRFVRRGGEYASHLDWHHQIRRLRLPQEQKWWCHLSEFPRSEQDTNQLTWFDKQKPTKVIDESENQTVHAKAYGNDPKCTLCLEGFTQFFNEDKEEWHLKKATTFDGELYHPFCRQNQKVDNTTRKEMPELEEVSSTEDVFTIPVDSSEISRGSVDESKECEHNKIINVFENNLSNEDFDGDILEIVEIKPILETIDLSDNIDDCIETTNTEIKSESSDLFMMRTKDGDLNLHGSGMITLDGDAEYTSHIIVKTNPIKINLTTKLDKAPLDRDESHREDIDNKSIDLSPATVKPRIAKADLVTRPAVMRGKDTSALCSIM